MLFRNIIWGMIALLMVEVGLPARVRASDAPPTPPPASEGEESPKPPCVDPLLQQIADDTAHLREELDKNKKKKKDKKQQKKRTFIGRLIRVSVYVGIVGILLGGWFVEAPFIREWRAESHYQQLLKAVDAVLEVKVGEAEPAHFELASSLLIDQLDQEELLTLLRQAEHEADESKILQTADDIGLGRQVIEDSRRWEKFYRDTHNQKTPANLKMLQVLVGRALQADWRRYHDQVGAFLASKMTMNDLLQRQLEIYRRR